MKLNLNFPSISTLCVLLLITTLSFAQAPDSLNYQAVVRDGAGDLVINAPVGVQISIRQGSAAGTIVFSEAHSPTSNANGLVTFPIGGGTPSLGTFDAIDWSDGPYFIETATDPTGGTSYSVSSVSQMLSVPYALHAGNALSVENYFAEIPSNYTPSLPSIVDFQSIVQNTDANVIERLPSGSILIKQSGTVHINVELLVVITSGNAIAEIFINGNLRSRVLVQSGTPVNALQTSCIWNAQPGDQISIEIDGNTINTLYGIPWSKLNIQWLGVKN